MRRLFDLYCNVTGKGQGIRSHYVYISRNSVMAASLAPLGQETFYCIKGMYFSVMSVNTFLSSLGFDDEQIGTLQNALPCNCKKTYPYFYRTKTFATLSENPLFRQMYDDLRAKNRLGFGLHLDSFGVDFAAEGMHVVDVGWKGLMQVLMQKYFGPEVKLKGYYLGVFAKKGNNLDNMDGLLYTQKDKKKPLAKFFRHDILIYEQLCRADHGHVDGYAVKDGKAEILLDGERHDKELFDEMFAKIQDDIAATFEKICRLDYDKYSNMENTAMRAYYRAVTHLNKSDYKWRIRAENYHYDIFCRKGYRHRMLSETMWAIHYRFCNFKFGLRYRFSLGKKRVRFASKKTYQKKK